MTTEVLRLDGELLVAVGSGTTRLATGQDLEIRLFSTQENKQPSFTLSFVEGIPMGAISHWFEVI